ncbi:hypothetical protein GCM10010210_55480 [Pseudonocardia hydrocarbonoxydans]
MPTRGVRGPGRGPDGLGGTTAEPASAAAGRCSAGRARSGRACGPGRAAGGAGVFPATGDSDRIGSGVAAGPGRGPGRGPAPPGRGAAGVVGALSAKSEAKRS